MACKPDDKHLAAFKARVAPYLNEPYFQIEPDYLAMTTGRCMHKEYGVRLDAVDRRCYCKRCGIQIDPFEALVNYAHAEQRLVSTRRAIEDAEKRQATQKQREKDRRPFARAVVGRVPRKDLSLKAEPVIGYTVTLSCGHTRETNGERQYRQVTCGDCEKQARKGRA